MSPLRHGSVYALQCLLMSHVYKCFSDHPLRWFGWWIIILLLKYSLIALNERLLLCAVCICPLPFALCPFPLSLSVNLFYLLSPKVSINHYLYTTVRCSDSRWALWYIHLSLFISHGLVFFPLNYISFSWSVDHASTHCGLNQWSHFPRTEKSMSCQITL